MLAKISGVFFIQVVGAGSMFLLHFYLAKFMGTREYGLYTYAYSWIVILSVVTKLGTQTSLVKFIAEYKINEEFQKIKGLLIFANGSVILASFGAALIISVLLKLDLVALDGAYITPLRFACMVLPLYTLMGVVRGTLQGFKLHGRAQTPDLLLRPFLMLLFVFGWFYMGKSNLDAIMVLIFLLITSLVSLLVGYFWICHAFPKGFWKLSPNWERSEWLKVSLPLILLGAMHMITQNCDIVMLGFFLKPDDVGIYAVCSRLSGLISFALTASALIVAPMIAEHFKTGDKEGLQSKLRKISTGVFVFTVLAAVFFVIFGEWLLGLFGSKYINGYMTLLILAGGQLINAFVGAAGLVMTMTSHQKEAGKIINVAACLNITLNAILIPLWGVIGASLATAASMAFWNIRMLRFVHKAEHLDTTFLGRVW